MRRDLDGANLPRPSSRRRKPRFAEDDGDELLGEAPVIPDWALDAHTYRGRKKGRGLDYFRRESTRLEPAPKRPDPYKAEAYEMWAVRDARKRKRSGQPWTTDQPTLFHETDK